MVHANRDKYTLEWISTCGIAHKQSKWFSPSFLIQANLFLILNYERFATNINAERARCVNKITHFKCAAIITRYECQLHWLARLNCSPFGFPASHMCPIRVGLSVNKSRAPWVHLHCSVHKYTYRMLTIICYLCSSSCDERLSHPTNTTYKLSRNTCIRRWTTTVYTLTIYSFMGQYGV